VRAVALDRRRPTLTSTFDRSIADFAIAPDSRTLYLTAEDSGYVRLFSVPATGGEVTPVHAGLSSLQMQWATSDTIHRACSSGPTRTTGS
jgi:hypothetical protein